MNAKVAVLGPIPRDDITTHNGERLSRYGCVLYTTSVLSALMGDEGVVVPVTKVRTADSPAIHALISDLPGVDPSHTSDASDTGDVISLRFVDQNRREERQTGFMSPITSTDVADLLDFDMFVLVPVTDFEISLDVVRTIKEESRGTVVLDAHGPTTTVTTTGERHRRFWLDRDQWLPHVDVLKMNLEEAACAWFDHEYDADEMVKRGPDYELPLEELPKLAEHCLDQGVRALYVTLDEYGCVIYHRDGSGSTEETFLKRVLVEDVIDTTGAGDSFAGGIAFGLLHTGDFVEAGKYGNAAGAQRCAGREQMSYLSLADTNAQIEATYG